MKKIFSVKNNFIALLSLITVLAVNGCKKDSDGSPDYKAGDPVATTVVPAEGGGGTTVTIQGTGLGQMRTIVFDKNNVPAPFTVTLNSENAMIFRVPDTAFGGPQNIVLTNSDGKTLTVPFKVIALPGVNKAFPTDFEAGTEVTLEGINLESVTKVVFEGTTEQASIVSKSRKIMVIKMPVTTSVNRAKLLLTNSSGDKLSDMEFVNVDKAQCVFKDDLVNGFQDWGWGGTYKASTDDKITGTSSMKAAYDPAGSWGGMQLGGGAINLSGYKYFSFWAKGADIDKNITANLNWNGKVLTIPAGKWTYFRFELATTNEWKNITNVDNVTFQINGDGKTILFDNMMFFK